MAIVNFSKNGQGYFDFETFAKLTSDEFVEKIKDHIDSILNDDEEFELKVDLDCDTESVFIITNRIVTIYRFYGPGYIKSMAFSKRYLKDIVGELCD